MNLMEAVRQAVEQGKRIYRTKEPECHMIPDPINKEVMLILVGRIWKIWVPSIEDILADDYKVIG